MKKIFETVLIIILFILTPLLAQQKAPEVTEQIASAANPELWIWKFEAGETYPNPAMSIPIKVDLDLMAMDKDMNIYPIEITGTLREGSIIFIKSFGTFMPGPKRTVTLIENPHLYGPGYYHIQLKATCAALGKSETLSRSIRIN